MSQEKNILALHISIAAVIIAVVALVVSLTGTGSSAPAAATPAAFYKAQAKDAGIRSKKFEQCLADPAIKAKINAQASEANALGGSGTPFNVIQAPDGTLYPVAGALPQDVFEQIINEIKSGEVNLPEDYVFPDPALITNFNPETDRFKGNPNAEIVIYEYSDFECPFCSRVHPTLNNVIEKYPDVAWVYRHLPLGFHKQAMPAAIASECIAQEKGNEAFWKFADTVYGDQNVLK